MVFREDILQLHFINCVQSSPNTILVIISILSHKTNIYYSYQVLDNGVKIEYRLLKYSTCNWSMQSEEIILSCYVIVKKINWTAFKDGDWNNWETWKKNWENFFLFRKILFFNNILFWNANPCSFQLTRFLQHRLRKQLSTNVLVLAR
jgi:hypothetical protein